MAGMVCDTEIVEWIEFNFIKKILKFIYTVLATHLLLQLMWAVL